ncbi:hypothetical protein [Streptomyces sp. NPDC047097]|uniref:hypothetical protein n=1 Tax=Streptomyces sp. NPDC047097 TaxID=3155260 RepID=UPI0033C951CA
MAETDLPGDLLAAQMRLHQASADLSALLRSLPWSVEPMGGWPGTEHPHTGEVAGGREPSPGWTEEQKAVVDRLRQECSAPEGRAIRHLIRSHPAECRPLLREEGTSAPSPGSCRTCRLLDSDSRAPTGPAGA